MVNADRAPSTATAVLVHGFLDDGDVWASVVEELSDTGPAPVVVELAGMAGAPDVAGPYSLQRHADDVTALLAEVSGPVVLVGQSTGAQIIELVAAANPERVAGLVLVTPVPLAGAGLPEEAVAPFKALGGQPDAQRQARQQLAAAFPAKELERLVAAGAQIDPEAVPQFVDAWNRGIPSGEQPSSFTGPVLVLRGAADPFCTAEVVATGVTSRFVDPRVVAVEDAGHWAHVEQPEVLAGHLRSFLSALAAGGNTATGVQPEGWTDAFAQKSSAAFGQAFAPDVRLEASALVRPIEGSDAVQHVMATASGIYESLVFTQQAAAGSRTYLEWEATAFGGTRLLGVTVLAKDDEGRITDIAIHHRPLSAALTFSRTLGDLLEGTVDRDHFYGA